MAYKINNHIKKYAFKTEFLKKDFNNIKEIKQKLSFVLNNK